jgi:hypothetical protein
MRASIHPWVLLLAFVSVESLSMNVYFESWSLSMQPSGIPICCTTRGWSERLHTETSLMFD